MVDPLTTTDRLHRVAAGTWPALPWLLDLDAVVWKLLALCVAGRPTAPASLVTAPLNTAPAVAGLRWFWSPCPRCSYCADRLTSISCISADAARRDDDGCRTATGQATRGGSVGAFRDRPTRAAPGLRTTPPKALLWDLLLFASGRQELPLTLLLADAAACCWR